VGVCVFYLQTDPPRPAPLWRTSRILRAHLAQSGTLRLLKRQLLTTLGVFTADSRHVEPGRRSQSAAESQVILGRPGPRVRVASRLIGQEGEGRGVCVKGFLL